MGFEAEINKAYKTENCYSNIKMKSFQQADLETDANFMIQVF